jgi:hypothetical protein
MSVSFLRLHSGDILFFYLRKNGPRPAGDDAALGG